MNAESSREPDLMALTFVLPKGLRENQAFELFRTSYKPDGLRFEKWRYDKTRGHFYVWGKYVT